MPVHDPCRCIWRELSALKVCEMVTYDLRGTSWILIPRSARTWNGIVSKSSVTAFLQLALNGICFLGSYAQPRMKVPHSPQNCKAFSLG